MTTTSHDLQRTTPTCRTCPPRVPRVRCWRLASDPAPLLILHRRLSSCGCRSPRLHSTPLLPLDANDTSTLATRDHVRERLLHVPTKKFAGLSTGGTKSVRPPLAGKTADAPSADRDQQAFQADQRFYHLKDKTRCSHTCPFDKDCWSRYNDEACQNAAALARSGKRARGSAQKPQAGYSIARGTFIWHLHHKASKDRTLPVTQYVYDVGARLREAGIQVDGPVGPQYVCEGYAAFMYGYKLGRNVWKAMRDRVSGGYLGAYDDANAKRETVRQLTDGTVDVLDGGGEHGGGGGGGGGRGGATTSPNPAAKKRARKGRDVIIRDTDRAQKVKAWLVEWGRIIGDKLPEGPTQLIKIFIYPTCDVDEVHRLYSEWCDTHGLRGEYWTTSTHFKYYFNSCPEVRLSRKKGNFKGCPLCIGRASALAKALPADIGEIRAKYEVGPAWRRAVVAFVSFRLGR